MASDERTPLRMEFDQWYAAHAFDYERNPIGSRECGLQWEAYYTAATRATPPPVTVDDVMVERALIAFRDAPKASFGNHVDYHTAMRAALLAALNPQQVPVVDGPGTGGGGGMKYFREAATLTGVQFTGDNIDEIRNALGDAQRHIGPHEATKDDIRYSHRGYYKNGDIAQMWCTAGEHTWMGFRVGDWIMKNRHRQLFRVRKSEMKKGYIEVTP